MTRANLCVLLSTSFFALVAVGGQALWLIQQAGHVGGALLLACYFLLASLSYVALVKAMWTSPGRLADLKASAISVQEEPAQTCDKCAAWKPERGHHCSTCGECTLKMDHHCHWISSCVGFRNYKFFFLFVVYGTLTQAPAGFEAWDYAAMACLCLVGPMSIFSVGFAPLHCALVLVNQTTIENIKKVPQDKYDIGTFRNCQQVLGANPLAWGCPFVWGVDESLYDGVCWDRAGHLAGAPKSAAEDALGGTDSDAEVKVHVDGGDTLIECQAAIEPTNTHLHATGAGHAIEPN
ncbi:DHHC palmitoyltransferase-domain-containing protein, partial [Baffinella frigidus]